MKLLRGAFWLLAETATDHRPSPRRLARPLLRSPWPLGIAVLVLALGIWVTSTLVSYNRALEDYYAAHAAPAPTATAQPTPAPTTPTASAPPTTPSEPTTSPTEVDLDEHTQGDLHDHAAEGAPAADAADTLGIATAASTFTATWLSGAGLRDTVAVTEWRTRVNATVDPALVPALDATDPVSIPTVTITSQVLTASSVAEGTVLVLLSDGTAMEVTVTTTTAGWLVTNYQPVSS